MVQLVGSMLLEVPRYYVKCFGIEEQVSIPRAFEDSESSDSTTVH